MEFVFSKVDIFDFFQRFSFSKVDSSRPKRRSVLNELETEFVVLGGALGGVCVSPSDDR